jgi:hypothetical protein
MPETVRQHREPEPGHDGDKRKRRAGNIVLLVAARKADECIAAGRRNCGPTGVIFPR